MGHSAYWSQHCLSFSGASLTYFVVFNEIDRIGKRIVIIKSQPGKSKEAWIVLVLWFYLKTMCKSEGKNIPIVSFERDHRPAHW